ncbi:CDP-alcohol phosphatidyltransferase family protein [Actinomadura logoneensis]|uniref:Bifunctional IPC transferase and DIPP synthase n=1 Tax=Actinomadura logoneensis TaxID=2293572 RepID=A0A372JE31_9ACTN|nr:CDP-alcohol phosphatidyltransferase family protein [Actinomadura logoneensis]RFU38271.1 CDP-alcohol phosphatidyltransferase family protein [Actinomadura logoneensis]
MTLAVIIATGRAEGPDPFPAAAVPVPSADGGVSLLTRLVRRLERLGVAEHRVITRPALAPPLRKDGHDPVECEDTAADLREIARLARRARTPVVLLPGDLVISDEQLTRLVLDAADRPATAVTVRRPAGRGRPVRVDGSGRVVSAGSGFHRVSAPTADFPGPLCVGEQRTVQAAEIAESIAVLLEVPGALPAVPPAPPAPPTALPAISPSALTTWTTPQTAPPPPPEPEPEAEAETAPESDDGPADEHDALELLLVGLVRAGMPVTADPAAPELVCRRVSGVEAAQEALEAAERADEDGVRLRAAIKRDDGWFATYAVSSWSPLLVRAAAWLGVEPNAVTWASGGLAALAAFCFAGGDRSGMVAGAVLFYLAFVLDCVDGQLARFTRRYSPFGAWLDAMFDRLKEYAVYAGLAAGASAAAWDGGPHAGNVWMLATAALALQTVRHMVDFSYADRPRPAAPDAPPIPLTVAGDQRPERPRTPAAPAGTAERLSRATTAVPALHWAKKIVVLPIGERFAVICLTAALGTARLTFAVLLVWGWIAGCYTLTGRVMRALHG